MSNMYTQYFVINSERPHTLFNSVEECLKSYLDCDGKRIEDGETYFICEIKSLVEGKTVLLEMENE